METLGERSVAGGSARVGPVAFEPERRLTRLRSALFNIELYSAFIEAFLGGELTT
jgi:hypothetical protein